MGRARQPTYHPSVRTALIVLAVLTGGCAPRPDPGTFIVTAKAGPTCPVVTEPPDPACADRNVAGATIVVTRADGSGVVVARGVTDANGRIELTVPPGVYLVGAGEVEGLTAPEPLELAVTSGGATETVLHYDTGIR